MTKRFFELMSYSNLQTAQSKPYLNEKKWDSADRFLTTYVSIYCALPQHKEILRDCMR
ncbi:hypothetical protein VCRA2122O339_100112 [Vibrio crassostreae]|nr:hypothetical protein VCRA2120E331_100025 [Vibrio crassostreae]CAK3149133.1 hypothetical protein VCRA2127O345_100112 [Vibrio crassostreae]CAK3164635.1 hypothetical protein VCRA2120E330_110025 [Vibrio crassostreae]CAK3176485.1 hypothetical protein VCRA2122O338_100025 [Vibrio crassostreae]CAK3185184.1 hypothetical protein VCRA2122O339_100112 [Vibrio crassostreae]